MKLRAIILILPGLVFLNACLTENPNTKIAGSTTDPQSTPTPTAEPTTPSPTQSVISMAAPECKAGMNLFSLMLDQEVALDWRGFTYSEAKGGLMFLPDSELLKLKNAFSETLLPDTCLRIPFSADYFISRPNGVLAQADLVSIRQNNVDKVITYMSRLSGFGFKRIILDLHFFNETLGVSSGSNFSAFLEVASDAQLSINSEAFIKGWLNLIQAVESAKPAGTVIYYEIFNEPVLQIVSRKLNYYQVINDLVLRVRNYSSSAKLILAGGGWANLDQLEDFLSHLQSRVITDPNVFFNFHSYDPFEFTHQGANWAGSGPDGWTKLGCLPWPATPDQMNTILANRSLSCNRMDSNVASAVDFSNQEVVDAIRRYGSVARNRDFLKQRLNKALQIAEQFHIYNAPIMTEFGVSRSFVLPQAVINYTLDMVSVLNELKIGWTIYFGFRFNTWFYASAAEPKGGHYVPQLFVDSNDGFVSANPIEKAFVIGIGQGITEVKTGIRQVATQLDVASPL